MDKQSMSPSEAPTPYTRLQSPDKSLFKPIRLSDHCHHDPAGTSSPCKTNPSSPNPEHSAICDLSDTMFIPKFISSKYKLYFGPTNLYMFLVYFYSIYERIIKAYELVN